MDDFTIDDILFLYQIKQKESRTNTPSINLRGI